jgi:hypothetical protein
VVRYYTQYEGHEWTDPQNSTNHPKTKRFRRPLFFENSACYEIPFGSAKASFKLSQVPVFLNLK